MGQSVDREVGAMAETVKRRTARKYRQIRIREGAHRLLDALAKREKRTMIVVLDRALSWYAEQFEDGAKG